jgi:hypothetical protein
MKRMNETLNLKPFLLNQENLFSLTATHFSAKNGPNATRYPNKSLGASMFNRRTADGRTSSRLNTTRSHSKKDVLAMVGSGKKIKQLNLSRKLVKTSPHINTNRS